jgi:hypothetical protein
MDAMKVIQLYRYRYSCIISICQVDFIRFHETSHEISAELPVKSMPVCFKMAITIDHPQYLFTQSKEVAVS